MPATWRQSPHVFGVLGTALITICTTGEYIPHNSKHQGVKSFFRSSQVFTDLFCFSQIDQNVREDFNLSSDVDFKVIRSVVMGKVPGEYGDNDREGHSS